MARFAIGIYVVAVCILLGLLNGCATRSRGLSYSPVARNQLVDYPLKGNTRPVHDPSLIKQADTYYTFTSDVPDLRERPGLPIRCSRDRVVWASCGRVFQGIPQWIRAKVPDIVNLWAPDVAFFHGLYHVYYAGSTLGSQRSVIALATNPTLDPGDPAYHWTDRGEVLESLPGMDFNAIDPNILVDGDGKVWMTYGSYWSGIKQIQIDPNTGHPLKRAHRYSLAARMEVPGDPIEGASLVHHGGYYYLFVSVDFCCNRDFRTNNYKEAVGRARTPHGPFKDEAGTPMLNGGGTVLLDSNGTWIAPGGGTVYVDPVDDQSLIVFHALKLHERGALYLWVRNIAWQNDWPTVQP